MNPNRPMNPRALLAICAFLCLGAASCFNVNRNAYERARQIDTAGAYRDALARDLPTEMERDIEARLALRAGVDAGVLSKDLERMLRPIWPYGIYGDAAEFNRIYNQTDALRKALVANGPQAVELAIALARHPMESIQDDAIRALGDLGDPRAAAPLVELLPTKVPRNTVLVALEKIGVASALPGLLAFHASHKGNDRKFTDRALYAIAVKARPVDALLPHLKGDDPPLRVVISLLGCIGDSRALPPLLQLMKERPVYEPWVVEELHGFADDAAVRALAEVVERPVDDGDEKRDPVPGEPASAESLALGLEHRRAKTIAGSSLEALATRRDTTACTCSCARNPKAAAVLERALRRRDLQVVAGATGYFIPRGIPGSETTMIDALFSFGSSQMALDFLNSGNALLSAAGGNWCDQHGVKYESKRGTWKGNTWGKRR